MINYPIKEMEKLTKNIILKEPDLIIRNILLDLIQYDKKNEDRLQTIYLKYK